MKRILTIVLSVCLASSCSDYLDQDPEQLNTLEKVFANRSEVEKWHAQLFSSDYFMDMLQNSSFYQPFLAATDDAANMVDWHVQTMYLGQINPSQPAVSNGIYFFSRYYQAIRHANIFLENIDEVKDMGELERTRLVAEARFMRAMYHFWILRAYGPIPIIESSSAKNEDGTLIPRNSMDECVTWLVNELDAVVPNLSEVSLPSSYGFPTQGAALAMKSRILLYGASPMYNGNSVYSNWKNKDGKQLISQTYDNEKWKLAADAAMAVISKGNYELLQPAGSSFDDYVENYRKISTTWNSELIWARPSNTNWWVSGCLPGAFSGWNGRNSLTLELANDYFMADGSKAKPLEEWFQNRTFSSAPGNGTVENTFSMFVDREPRFYASVHFPNMEVSYAPASHPNAVYRLGFWFTGNSGLASSGGDRNYTGLTPRKHIPLQTTSYKGNDGVQPVYSPNIPYPEIRLAEIYLNYSEAMNEYAGTSGQAQVLQYLNAVRERSGVPAYTGSYTKEQMREMIRQERRVELSWEGHRFFDVRRWFIGHGPQGEFNKPVHGFDLTTGTHEKDLDFFTLTEIQNRVFRREHYMFPIRASEDAFNTELVQAPFY